MQISSFLGRLWLMREKVQALALATFLAVGIIVPSLTFAQDEINRTGAITQENNTAPTTVDRFNAVWLLPLVLIPFIAYLLWPKRKEDREDLSYNGYAGVKGGRAKKSDEGKEYNKETLLSDENKFM